jgi:hypothetical protein
VLEVGYPKKLQGNNFQAPFLCTVVRINIRFALATQAQSQFSTGDNLNMAELLTIDCDSGHIHENYKASSNLRKSSEDVPTNTTYNGTCGNNGAFGTPRVHGSLP